MSVRDPELQAQLARLAERSAALGEDAAALPRGALPALFRALAAAAPEERVRAIEALAARLPDFPLAAPTLQAAREHGLEAPLVGALRAQGAERRAWCALRQAAALAGDPDSDEAPAAGWVVRALAALLAEQPVDPTELALERDPAAFGAALEEVLRLRLRTPAAQRDRTSARLARGALRALVAVLPDVGRVQELISQVLAAETRRAGKDEPELALAALDALAAVPPLARLELLAAFLPKVERKKVKTRMEALHEATAAELGAGPAEVAELTARTGGAGPDGWARVALEEGGEVRVRIGAAGTLERVGAPDRLEREDARAIEGAERELEAAWSELARRLEVALVEGRTWRPRLWRSLFLGTHPLWSDLAARLAWELRRPGEAPQTFAIAPAEGAEPALVDLFGEPFSLSDDDPGEVAVLHPVRLDPDELELWREWALGRARPAPFAQLFRRVQRPAAPEGGERAEPLARFVGRELFRDALPAFGERSGWTGTSLRGAAPWELERRFEARGLVARLALEEVQLAFKATLAQRKAAHRRAREGEKVQIQRSRDDKPRLRITAATLEGEPAPEAVAEVVRGLEELTDALATPDELALRAWQQDKWRDPQPAWRELVLAYREGSPAALEVRRALIAAFARREALSVRLEDRFAITGQWVVELGTGLCHQGPPKDYLPRWKVDELLQQEQGASQPLPFPFVPAADRDTVEVVTRVVGLARLAAAAG